MNKIKILGKMCLSLIGIFIYTLLIAKYFYTMNTDVYIENVLLNYNKGNKISFIYNNKEINIYYFMDNKYIKNDNINQNLILNDIMSWIYEKEKLDVFVDPLSNKVVNISAIRGEQE